MKIAMTVATLVIGAMATAAGAQYTATAAPLTGTGGYQSRAVAAYSSIPGPYSAFAAATGAAGFDDYGTSITDPTFTLASLRFVGGVTSANGQIRFNFYDSTATLFSTFTSTFLTPGDFIWTVNLGTPALDNADSTFQVPSNGFVELVIDAGTTGRWFFTTTAPSVGTNNIATGTSGTLNPQRYSAFELNAIPAPASLTLLGLGGLVATRRRR